MIHTIRLFGDPCLRRPAREVRSFDDDLDALADDMVETMLAADGAGLAAPQIGVPLRLFVMTGYPEGREEGDEAPTPEEERAAARVVVNPVLLDPEGELPAFEGCLSLPGLYHEAVPRRETLVLRHHDVFGSLHERVLRGREAVIVQHETDHLDGVLFIDRLGDAERRAFMEEHRAELAEFQRGARAQLKELRASGTAGAPAAAAAAGGGPRSTAARRRR